ncbi:MAG TPA: type IX secretion system membrane protein PorP/SprF [Bacteroidetes bacterium]|nr:type IX secretion system membrane protein PorP/SprF [Bacteroidota bacterium]
MKKLIYTLLITFTAVSGWSQSEDIFTFNLFNQLNFNPAYAGAKEVLDAGAIYRNQWWSGVEGAPRDINLWGHMPFAGRRNGLGLNIISDNIGMDNIFKLGVDYAYRILLPNRKVLAFGLGAQFETARTNWAETNGSVQGGDSQIGTTDSRNSVFNIGPGIFYKTQKFYLGFSVPKLLANSLYDNKDEFNGSVNTYFIQGGLSMPISHNVEFLPNAQIRINPNSPFDFDLNANVMFNDALMVGLMYRYEDSLDGLVVYQFTNGLRLGVAVDFTASELSKATTGSYEIMVGYTFPCEDCKIVNLRYF